MGAVDCVHEYKNSSLAFPGKRITVNLAPADIRKEGPAYDLPIAVGVLIASEQVWPQAVEGALFVGELSLDGSVRHSLIVEFGREMKSVHAEEAARRNGIRLGGSDAVQDAEN